MDNGYFEEKINELVREIGTIPDPSQEKLTKMAHEYGVNQKKLQKSIQSIQESIDHLRVSVKYLLFDLEATRRENTYLKRLLDERHGD